MRRRYPTQGAFQLTDGEIEPRDGQGKHALADELAGDAHRVLVVGAIAAFTAIMRSSVATYRAVPLKRWLLMEEV